MMSERLKKKKKSQSDPKMQFRITGSAIKKKWGHKKRKRFGRVKG